jgi:aquaporin Z
MPLVKRSVAELLGTFWLVLGGCGASVLSVRFPNVGIGIHGVALAFGLAVVSGMYALGAISGGHFNPAITLGLATARRFPLGEVIPYWVAQLVGAVGAAAVLYLIAAGRPGFDAGGFASNGYGSHSPGLYGLGACLLCELVMSFLFVLVFLGSTDAIAYRAFAALAVGLALTLIHLVSIPVTNTSVNPARSTGPALFHGGWALEQLWLFWVAPLVGGALAGVAYPALVGERPGAPAAWVEEEHVAPAAEPEERRAPPREPLPTP